MIDVSNAYNLAYIEALYASYSDDPSSVTDEWRSYFGELEGRSDAGQLANILEAANPIERKSQPRDSGNRVTAMILDRVRQMIHAYRTSGHWAAAIDPLNLRNNRVPELDPDYYGFTPSDWELLLPCEDLQFAAPVLLREIVARLRSTYCRSVGVEFMHIRDSTSKRWLQSRMEATENRTELKEEQQRRILSRLIHAGTFEEFIRKKFLGAKSFSIEGAESLIPLLDVVIEQAAEQGQEEIVFAMAHRGRLNVLANIIGKKPREIFREFVEPPGISWEGSGDVKYHLGHSHDYQTHSGRKIHLSLCFNPSHLEFVNPVALGRMRAKQDRVDDRQRQRGMALLIHGDAAFAAEGISQETLNLSQLPAYTVGGSLHVIVNNQIGFTTSPQEARSTVYASDIVRMLDVPVFHVNGDDPEAVAWVVQLAMQFRKTFHRDAVIDMYCYRRWGHNEGDEPSFTQPLLYQAIKNQKTVQQLYLQRLLEQGRVRQQQAERISRDFRSLLEDELAAAHNQEYIDSAPPLRGIWAEYEGGLDSQAEVETGVEQKRLIALLEAQTRLPKDFHPHPKIERAIMLRRKMASGDLPVDWSAAEALAFASIAAEDKRVRISGEDSGRGTFSHRHGILHDYRNGRPYVPLRQLLPYQAPVEIVDSPLSEAAVLGFEYGYSLDCPNGLVLWEAQFGDFCNAAQVIIDQFITTAEEKWRRLSGLVMLLPHGFEGMGPEHSSARLERFLQLGARDNIQVVYPTSPAQYFHCLRRQVLRRWRKPLVILTPKSLLRHPQVVSTLSEFSQGRFQTVIPDGHAKPERVKRVLLCSGKIFYELDKARKDSKREDIAIIRLEQLYPLSDKTLRRTMEVYPEETPALWVQEEPENMGAWSYLNLKFKGRLFEKHAFSVVCRPAAASPATGWMRSHKDQQELLLKQAVGEASQSERRAAGHDENGKPAEEARNVS